MKQRKRYSSEFKAKVGLEAVKGMLTLNELSSKYGVHGTQINKWKKQIMDNLPNLFSDKTDKKEKSHEQELEKLYSTIGQLKIENDFLEKAVSRK